MKRPIFTGTATALVTPFNQCGIHFEMLEKILSFQFNNGIRNIVLCGTTGEAPTLSDSEKTEIYRFSRGFLGKDAVLIAGTGSNCTSHAVDLSIAAQECGMDALLVVTPYYNKATPKGLIAHYLAIADAVQIPIILYNVPSRTGVNIPIEVYRELSAHPNIIGVKEASGDLQTALRIRCICPEDFYIWSGNDDMTVPIMAIGGQGVISVASNVCPKQMLEMTNAMQNRRFEEATRIQISLLPLIQSLFSEVNPIPVKEAMRLIGFDCGSCRLPLCEMDSFKKEVLVNILQKN